MDLHCFCTVSEVPIGSLRSQTAEDRIFYLTGHSLGGGVAKLVSLKLSVWAHDGPQGGKDKSQNQMIKTSEGPLRCYVIDVQIHLLIDYIYLFFYSASWLFNVFSFISIFNF